ncbi:melanopsin-like [Saccostrea echinata]|uniref:melanopsin-like n=1 Tax=Saccostrea echinata TaxID=191078 RepID=UPI002A8274BA|nr:melanopsin-like [Saccostrea echinata]
MSFLCVTSAKEDTERCNTELTAPKVTLFDIMNNSAVLLQNGSLVEQTTLPANLYYILSAYLTFTAVISFCGNSLVIYIFTKSRLARYSANFFIVNIGIANLFESLLGYPMAIISNIYCGWYFGDLGCQLYAFFVFSGAVCNIMTYAFLGIYRYLLVCNPESEFIGVEKVGLTIGLIWLYAILWSTFPFIGWGKYGIEPFGTSCSIDWTSKSENVRSYIMSVFLLVFILPVGIITIFYFKVSVKIRKTVSLAPDGDTETMSSSTYSSSSAVPASPSVCKNTIPSLNSEEASILDEFLILEDSSEFDLKNTPPKTTRDTLHHGRMILKPIIERKTRALRNNTLANNHLEELLRQHQTQQQMRSLHHVPRESERPNVSYKKSPRPSRLKSVAYQMLRRPSAGKLKPYGRPSPIDNIF